MKILLLGATGQLGSELLPRLQSIGEVFAPTRGQFNALECGSLALYLDRIGKPDWIVNTISYKNVDGAEDKANEQEAIRLNRILPNDLGMLNERRGIRVVHYSTDFVFDGNHGKPYVETDWPSPVNFYGNSKLCGEWHLRDRGLVIRTSGLYRMGHPNFVTSIARKARVGEEIRVVEDQIGNPTWAPDLAEATAELIRVGASPGLLHLAGIGSVSRYDFAREIVGLLKSSSVVVPIKTSELREAAARPKNSSLDCSKAERLYGIRLPAWHESLERALQEEGKQ